MREPIQPPSQIARKIGDHTSLISRFVVSLPTCQVQEHLLEGGLAEGVVLEPEAIPEPLHGPKQLGPGDLLAREMQVDEALMDVLDVTAREERGNVGNKFIKDSLRDFWALSLLYLGDQSVTLAEFRFKLLNAAQAFELTVDHDG